ncbi:toprim domain-containing protein [Roseococcus sp. DSY-14]|uniref:DUF7146 domain-containing protein n=1 Tax=Roseococcus sp. DSY-14 TaxID=3369650 RepID=UPI00387B4AE9
MTPDRPDIPTVNERLADRMASLALALAGEPSHRCRDELRFRTRGSLAVVVAGNRRGTWYDHEAGVGGDALGFVAHLIRRPMRDAFQWALDWLGDPSRFSPPPKPARPPAPPRTTLELARRIWGECSAAAGTPVETYLAARGLRLEPGVPLRFHPRCPRDKAERLPAMVALMTSPETGEPCGVHRTFLEPHGRDRLRDWGGKLFLGSAGCIRLSPDDDVTVGLGIAEGIETGLAVMQGFGWRPMWAAGSAGAIARFPLLPGVECISVFADTGQAGMNAARACCTRWADAGREALLITPPAGDFNDLVQGGRHHGRAA